MEIVVDIHEAKTRLSQLLRRVADGEEVIIARDGNPVARLIPYSAFRAHRAPGLAAEQVTIADDFTAPLQEEDLRAWEGL